jgi:hypothetical protein
VISATEFLGDTLEVHPLRDTFLKWQCRVRQMAMREHQGRPGDAVMPKVFLPGKDAPIGQIITVLNKTPANSLMPEMLHMARKTNDPAQVRFQAIQFLSATYYQKHRSFCDMLTAVFPPNSPGAAEIRAAETCTLVFEAYAQRFDLCCRVWQLAPVNPLHGATMAHNRLFTPSLPADTVVLAFEPDWSRCSGQSTAA